MKRVACFVVFLSFACTALADSINVSQIVAPQRQQSSMTCWMTGAAMVYGSKNNQSIDAPSLAQTLGPPWRTMFQANQGLAQADVSSFAAALGLVYAPPANPTPTAWAHWLAAGPVWVVVIPPGGHLHVWIIVALNGDGSGSTAITYNDPADGLAHTVPFSTFLKAMEAVAGVPGPVFPQIIHL